MAKYIIEYNIHIGDRAWFDNNGIRMLGTVQDISQLPDVWLEGYDQGEYKRWCRGINSIDIDFSDHDTYGKYEWADYEKHESVEFVYDDYNNRKYRSL